MTLDHRMPELWISKVCKLKSFSGLLYLQGHREGAKQQSTWSSVYQVLSPRPEKSTRRSDLACSCVTIC